MQKRSLSLAYHVFSVKQEHCTEIFLSLPMPGYGRLMASTASQIKPSIVRIQAQAPGGNSIGTGFLVSKEGHVITCWHVVTFHSVDKDGLLQFEYSDRIVVTWNNRDYNAKVIHRQNTDTPYTSDFALLKIEASGTPFLQLGAYKDVEQGDE